MQLSEKADPSTDTVVLLGGLAMPKMEVDVNGLKTLIKEKFISVDMERMPR